MSFINTILDRWAFFVFLPCDCCENEIKLLSHPADFCLQPWQLFSNNCRGWRHCSHPFPHWCGRDWLYLCQLCSHSHTRPRFWSKRDTFCSVCSLALLSSVSSKCRFSVQLIHYPCKPEVVVIMVTCRCCIPLQPSASPEKLYSTFAWPAFWHSWQCLGCSTHPMKPCTSQDLLMRPTAWCHQVPSAVSVPAAK